jgi:hypothetical protein
MVERPKPPAEVARLATNAAYAAVGFGVMGVQKVLAGKDQVRARLGPRGEAIDKGFSDLITQLSDLRSQVGTQLTPRARDLFDKAQSSARSLQDQVKARELIDKAQSSARSLQDQVKGRFSPADDEGSSAESQ